MSRSAAVLLVFLAASIVRGEERAFLLEAQVERLASASSLWPGFEPLTIPLAVFDGERTYFGTPLIRAPGLNVSFEGATVTRAPAAMMLKLGGEE